LIIVLDQFTRNTRRDTAEMYANDPQARSLTRMLLDSGDETTLHPAVRMFAIMPLMHSEDPVDQARAVACFERCLEDSEGHPQAHRIEMSLKSANHHRDIVVEWGRFPHRNAILGRESTPEEVEFLAKPGSSF
jgi:uncharacterized protein (DUF924 family)